MFKVGDKVRRITASSRLDIGGIYTVSLSSGQWIGLYERPTEDPSPWHAPAFELVPPPVYIPGEGISDSSKSEKGINPKDLLGQKKVDLSLIPPAALIYIALAMEDGEKKYGPYNFREKKVRARVYLAAAMRHIAAKLDGEELASDSLKPHLAHAMACLAIYVDAEETGNLQDDRPSPGAASRLIAKWEKKPEDKKETA